MRAMIKGAYQTRFGELWDKGIKELMLEVGKGAMKDAKVKVEEIDLVLVSNMLGSRFENQGHLGAMATSLLGIKAGGLRVEGACASGGLAINQAVTAIKAGEVKTVLVIGVEKMTDKRVEEVAQGLMGAASEEERRAGLSFVGLYALMARKYFKEFGAGKKDLAYVAVKNHNHASMNPKAQFPFEIDVDKVLGSFCVAEPLGLFDCAPITDGAAGLVISKRGKDKRSVEILASKVATDSPSLTERKSLLELEATKIAGKKAYKEAGIKPDEIDMAEVHDCFTIAEILAIEDLGWVKKGEGFKAVKKGEFSLGGRLPVNLSGGLKACGHPVGATGVKQVVEVVTQLRGEAGGRQKKRARLGLTHNIGGTGGTAVVHILKKL